MAERWIFGAVLFCLLSGCATTHPTRTITQTARAVALRDGEAREICVVEDPRVHRTFLPAFRAALEARGFSVRLLGPASSLNSCPLTATYYARSSWDFAVYMSHARIVVYRDGVEAGHARYDAPKAGSALTMRIYEPTESKVAAMVDGLFLPPAQR